MAAVVGKLAICTDLFIGFLSVYYRPQLFGMPTLVKPSSSFLFILVSLDCHQKRQKRCYLFKNVNLKLMEVLYSILKSYKRSLDTDSHIHGLMNFENVNTDRVLIL